MYTVLAEHGSVEPTAADIQWAEKVLRQLPPFDELEFTPLPSL